MTRERIQLGPEHRTLIVGDKAVTMPLARIVREDGQPRTHHPRCPSHPGEPLDSHAVCADCIYGDYGAPCLAPLAGDPRPCGLVLGHRGEHRP